MAKGYDLKRVVCSVGGVVISGYGDSDAVSVAWDSDLQESRKTADGDVLYSRNNDGSMTVTITLHQRSRAYALLAGLMQTQILAEDTTGVLAPLPFMLQDLANGDNISAADCVFLNRPAPSKGKTVGDVQFKLHLPKAIAVFGALNTI